MPDHRVLGSLFLEQSTTINPQNMEARPDTFQDNIANDDAEVTLRKAQEALVQHKESKIKELHRELAKTKAANAKLQKQVEEDSQAIAEYKKQVGELKHYRTLSGKDLLSCLYDESEDISDDDESSHAKKCKRNSKIPALRDDKGH